MEGLDFNLESNSFFSPSIKKLYDLFKEEENSSAENVIYEVAKSGITEEAEKKKINEKNRKVMKEDWTEIVEGPQGKITVKDRIEIDGETRRAITEEIHEKSTEETQMEFDNDLFTTFLNKWQADAFQYESKYTPIMFMNMIFER